MGEQRFLPVGELIALHRRRRGLSQVQLAGLLGRSESWLSQVERGVRTIDRISVLVEIADVLNVPVSELTAGIPLVRHPRDHGAVEAVELVLSSHHGLDALLGGEARPGPAPDLAGLRRQVRQAWELAHGSRFRELGALLAGLLPGLERAARELGPPHSAEAFALLASAYQVTSAMMAKLGAADLAWVAADRSAAAAERSGQGLLVAASSFRLSHAFLAGGQLQQARHAAGTAARALEGRLAEGPKELISLWGALNLVSAIAAARQNDPEAAWGCLGRAEVAARRLGADRDDFGTEFGPTNVAVHRVAVAVELGDSGEALRRAAGVDPSRLSPERRARFLIDVARAHAQRHNVAAATSRLLEAEELAAEEVRRSPSAHDVVRGLLRRERRKASPHLRALAQRIGILP